MDTFQWLDAAFAQYKQTHSIFRTKTYSALCEESNGNYKVVHKFTFTLLDLIDFLTPMGFSFRLDSKYSTVLSKSVSLRLPGNTFRLGFIHQSPQTTPTPTISFFGPYFMYGQLSSSSPSALEAYYSQRLRDHGHFSLSSSLLTGHCRSNLSWSFRGGRTSSTWSYCSFGRILGWQALNHFRGPKGSAWSGSWGGEVYYTAQENSGGISFGLRLEECRSSIGVDNGSIQLGSNTTDSIHLESPYTNLTAHNNSKVVLTLTGNPLMGHYRTTLTAPIICPGLRASCRYDINLNSFDSDLSAGVAYDLPSEAGAIKVAACMRSGLSFVLQTLLAEGIKVRFGLKTGVNDAAFGVDFVIKN